MPLSEALAGLRNELMQAFWASQFPYSVGGAPVWLRFRPAPVELTLQVQATTGGKANGGVKWWLVTAGGEVSRQAASTQTLKLTLEPVLFDHNGSPVEALIDAAEVEGPDCVSDVALDAAN